MPTWRSAGGPSTLSAADRRGLGALLPVVAGLYRDGLFTARDLTLRTEAADGAGLRLVLGVTDTGTSRRIGRRFKRASGVDVEGLRLTHVGSDRDGALWKIDATQ